MVVQFEDLSKCASLFYCRKLTKENDFNFCPNTKLKVTRIKNNLLNKKVKNAITPALPLLQIRIHTRPVMEKSNRAFKRESERKLNGK